MTPVQVICISTDICREVVTFVEAKLRHLSLAVTFVEAKLWHLSLAVTFVEGCCDICRGLWHLVGLWHTVMMWFTHTDQHHAGHQKYVIRCLHDFVINKYDVFTNVTSDNSITNRTISERAAQVDKTVSVISTLGRKYIPLPPTTSCKIYKSVCESKLM